MILLPPFIKSNLCVTLTLVPAVVLKVGFKISPEGSQNTEGRGDAKCLPVPKIGLFVYFKGRGSTIYGSSVLGVEKFEKSHPKVSSSSFYKEEL